MKEVVEYNLEDYDIQISNGIIRVIPKGTSENESKVLKKDYSNDVFVYIDFENFIKNGKKIMAHNPTTKREKEFKELLREAIEVKIENFYCTKIDPSLSEDWERIVFEAGKMPAIGRSYNWYEKVAEKFIPERNSRLGTKLQYVAFLGVLMQKLVEEKGMSVKDVWNAVCNDSKDLGHYRNSKDVKHKCEFTGSREICGFCDLANVPKILAWDDKDECFWRVGGDFDYYGYDSPLANFMKDNRRYNDNWNGVGWLVLS